MTRTELGREVDLRREDGAYVVTVPLVGELETPPAVEWRSGWLFLGTPEPERRVRIDAGTGEQVAPDRITVERRETELEVVVPVVRVGVADG